MDSKTVSPVLFLLIATLAAGCKPNKSEPTPKPTLPAAARKTTPASKPVSKEVRPTTAPASMTARPRKTAMPMDPRALRARAALMAYKKQLMGDLKKALRSGGFAKGIGVCKLRAPAIATAIAKGPIVVGRTSHKLRNPNNAAKEPWLQNLLKAYTSTRADQAAAFKGVVLEDGSYGYVQPIYLKRLCQTCHGKAKVIPRKVAAILKKLYPKDQATGFVAGDFRGLMWAKLRPAAAKEALEANKRRVKKPGAPVN